MSKPSTAGPSDGPVIKDRTSGDQTMRGRLAGDLLALAKSYAEATGAELTTIGQRFAGDWRFFTALAEGRRDFRTGKYDDVVAAFAADWPRHAVWPSRVADPLRPVTDAIAETVCNSSPVGSGNLREASPHVRPEPESARDGAGAAQDFQAIEINVDDVFTLKNGGQARIVHINDGAGEDHPVVALVSVPGVSGKRCLTYTADGCLIDGDDTSFDLDCRIGSHTPKAHVTRSVSQDFRGSN